MTKTEKLVASQLRAEGYHVFKGGWPDFLAVKNGTVRFIEVKSPSAPRFSPRQKAMQKALRKAGITVELLVARKELSDSAAERELRRIERAWSRGGKNGGPARAVKLSPERRREIALMGVRARLAKAAA